MPDDVDAASVADRLVRIAQRRTRSAIESWHDNDPESVVLMAPLAVELLGKAALWSLNPALLALTAGPSAESSLVRLARGDDIEAKGLRTIGLAGVLTRLDQTMTGFPIEGRRAARMIDARNGSTHIGSAHDEVRYVFLDCLTVTDFLLLQMARDRRAFYGVDRATVDALSAEHQESVEATVKMRLAKSRNLLRRREDRDGLVDFNARNIEREADRMGLVADHYVPGGTSTDTACPECGSVGRLFGYPDAEAEVDWDVEPLGNGQYESFAVGYWQASFDPSYFACTVCGLYLDGRDELEIAGLPARRFDLDDALLDDPSFNFEELTRFKYEYDE